MSDIPDHVVLKVGRIVIEFGKVDQLLWEQVGYLAADTRFKAVRLKKPIPENVEVDARFKHRLKMLRRLILSLTENDSVFKSKYDSFVCRLNDLQKVRSHLAHGRISFSDNKLSISDTTEHVRMRVEMEKDYARAMDVAVTKDRHEPLSKSFRQYSDEYMNIKYSEAQLDDHYGSLRLFHDQFRNYLGDVKSFWRGKLTPP